MTKKHYLQIILCTSLVIIASVLFSYYYKEYIAPESYTIGNITTHDYTELSIADYFSEGDVLFSQNINAMSFANQDGTATYICNFEPLQFNGLKNNYIMYVNEHLVSDIKQQAGAISGTYKLNYLNVDSTILCSSNIKIDFAFYSLSSKLQITLPFDEISYLYNYFKTDNFIVTLALNPFTMQNKDGEIDEKFKDVEEISKLVTEISTKVDNLEEQVSSHEKNVSNLLQSNEDKTNELNQAKTTIQADQVKNNEYKSQLATLTSSILEFETTNSNLLEADNLLKTKFEEQKTKVSSLTTKNNELETRLNDLITLIENYSFEDEKITITFMLNEKVYKIVSITQNSTTSVDNPPENDEYQFNYWEVDGSKIELSSYTFTKNTIVTANITKKITVNYYANDNLLETKKCLAGTLTYFPNTPTIHLKKFKGWSVDKQNVLNDFNFNNDISLYAVYEYAIDGNYTVTLPHTYASGLHFSCTITFNISNGKIGNVKFVAIPAEYPLLQYSFTDNNYSDIVQFTYNDNLSIVAFYTLNGKETPFTAQLIMNFNDVIGEWELEQYYNISREISDIEGTYTFNFEHV